MTNENAAFTEVLEAHVQIRQWLDGTAAPQALEALMARFAPSFSMLTLGGALLDRAGVHGFFLQAHGSRPGLQIDISQLREIQPGVVLYHEQQRQPNGAATARWSTVVFEAHAGHWRWLHLHETLVS